MMRYLSLFSGIEAASVAWEPLGWEPVAFCEIDAFPSAVLAHRYPDVPNLGDVTKVDWDGFKERYGAVDVIVGGSPCQSFSIAGERAGLDGESRLMYEYIRAVHDVRPTWFLWENVPGVFSTDAGRAFGILLDAMAELGYGMAWRVLDAQFFGVAQRRRRVFLVGHVGNGGIAASVLFDFESVSGNIITSKEKRAALAADVGDGACYGFKYDAGSSAGSPGYQMEQSPTLLTEKLPAICYALQSDYSTSINSHGNGYQDDGSEYTLNTVDKQSVVCIADDNAHAAIDEELSGTLKAGGGIPMIASVRSARGTTRAHACKMRSAGS